MQVGRHREPQVRQTGSVEHHAHEPVSLRTLKPNGVFEQVRWLLEVAEIYGELFRWVEAADVIERALVELRAADESLAARLEGHRTMVEVVPGIGETDGVVVADAIAWLGPLGSNPASDLASQLRRRPFSMRSTRAINLGALAQLK